MAYWDKISSRGDVEDRRSAAGSAIIGGGGILGLVLVVAFSILSGDPTMTTVEKALSQMSQQSVTQQTSNTKQFEGLDSYETFASTVLGSTNDVWSGVFSKSNKRYEKPKLVLFRNVTKSGCQIATSQMGPHYCPLDSTIYLDETFFDELTKRFGAKGGDVAQAYVIAHEVGHHVQNQLGILGQVTNAQQNGDTNANDLSVKLELQADCFAGVWGYAVQQKGILGPNEISEAVDAAEAVGDDHIQKSLDGNINPETWTHGSSEQRVSWFNRGFNSGKMTACNTFQD